MRPQVFIHIGDVHLQAGHPRNPDRLASLDQIAVEAEALPSVAGVLIPGDLFHAKSTAADRNDLAERLVRFARLAPVVVAPGNHDSQGDLEIFSRLQSTWPIYVVTRPQVLQVPLPGGETAAIAALPYPFKASLVAQGVAPGDTSAMSVELLDVIFMQLAQELAHLRVAGAIPLFLGHFNVRGAVSSTGQPQIGMELEVDRASLARLPAVYCALSHIHRAQEVGAGVYAGSIARLDYGEIEEKSYVQLTCRREGSEWRAEWIRRPLDVAPMWHIEGELTTAGFRPDHDELLCRRCGGDGDDPERRDGDGETLACEACAGSGRKADWSRDDVRVRYRYLASERPALNEQCIRDLFAGALRLKIESIAIPDRDLRAPEVARATTLEDKLAAYRHETVLAPGMAAKAALVQGEASDALAAVADQLARIERVGEAVTA